MVQVQAILFASLATSLFSAFLAMLGKQWLNRYASTDMRGTATERIYNRQRKQDGVVAWYFDNVMESLPLMLQAALLLLGCALSLYLWDVDITVASVVVGVTSLGFVFFIFAVIAGAVWDSCPYQTPGSHALRYVWSIPRSVVTSRVASAIFEPFDGLRAVRWLVCGDGIVAFLVDLVCIIPLTIITVIFHLGRAIFRGLVASPARALHFVRNAYTWFRTMPSTPGQESNNQMTRLNLGCISWTLRVSLDKDVHLSTFKHLLSIPDLAYFDPTLVLDCFRIFTSCVNAGYQRAVVTEGLEQLAILSTGGFLRTLLHLFITDPTSGVLADLRINYAAAFLMTHRSGRPMNDPPPVEDIFLTFVRRSWYPREVWRDHHRPSNQECNVLARDIFKATLVTYRRTQYTKVPRWILRAVLHYLSLDPPPSPSAVANCLQVVAIDLGCHIPDVAAVDERCVSIRRLSTLLTQHQCTCGTNLKSSNPEDQEHDHVSTPRRYSLQTEGHQHIVAICDPSGTRRTARDGRCDIIRRQYSKPLEIRMASCWTIFCDGVRKTEPSLSGSGDYTPVTPRILGGCVTQGSRHC